MTALEEIRSELRGLLPWGPTKPREFGVVLAAAKRECKGDDWGELLAELRLTETAASYYLTEGLKKWPGLTWREATGKTAASS